MANANTKGEYPGGCPICKGPGAEIRENSKRRYYIYCPDCGPIQAHGESFHEALVVALKSAPASAPSTVTKAEPEPVRKPAKPEPVQKEEPKKPADSVGTKPPAQKVGGFGPLIDFGG